MSLQFDINSTASQARAVVVQHAKNANTVSINSLPLHPYIQNSTLQTAFFTLVALVVSGAAFTFWKSLAPHRIKFPGPKGHFLYGNLLQLNHGHAETLTKWTQKFGGIFRVVIGNREAVFLNTHDAIVKTLVHQGAAFQSRPEFKLWHGAFSKALDKEAPTTIGTMKFNEKSSYYRRLLVPQLSHAKQSTYNHFFSRRYAKFVGNLAEVAAQGKAIDIGHEFWTTAVGINADQSIGLDLDDTATDYITELNINVLRQRSLGQPMHDYVPAIAWGEKLILAFSKPILPFIRHLPIAEWLDSFNKAEDNARALREQEMATCSQVLKELHERLDAGDQTPSVMGDVFRSLSAPLTHKEELSFATTLVGAGASVGTVLIWLAGKLAMNPEMQDKAYDAIKEEYGDMFPDPHDTDRVEYIKALGTEASRMYPPVPLGFSRATHKDTVVDNVHIPEDTLVIFNAFKINRDPVRYDEPEEFNPDRWTEGHLGRSDRVGESGYTKIGVPSLTHGVGRRFCVGTNSVNKAYYGILTLLLYFFKFERAPLDEEAKAAAWPSFRSEKECSTDMDAIKDLICSTDAQLLPAMVGMKFTARDPAVLARWLSEGCTELDQFDEANPTEIVPK